jgi:hypothetical protein
MSKEIRKYIDNFRNFEKSKLNEGIKDTMVGQIFTSNYEYIVDKIFNELKNQFDFENLIDSNDGMGSIEYRLKNGDVLTVRDDTFFAIPGYTVKVNDDEIECSYLSGRKLYKYLKNKRDEKYKKSDLDKVEKDRTNKEKERFLLDRQKEDKLKRLKDKYK